MSANKGRKTQKNYKYDAFISYGIDDKKITDQFVNNLKAHGFRLFYLPDSKNPGEFIDQIETALEDSQRLIVFASSQSMSSFYVVKEINSFLVLMAKDPHRMLIPVIMPDLGENQIPLFLRTVQYVDLRSRNLSDPVEIKTISEEIVQFAVQEVPVHQNLPDQHQANNFFMQLINDNIRNIKDLVSSSQYIDAAQQANEFLDYLRQESGGGIAFELRLNELRVWYAHALMYLGETNKALDLLNSVIQTLESWDKSKYEDVIENWYMVLGRAHNHIGYIHWMDLSHYEMALHEFRIAIDYFTKGNLQAEIATTLDNMGRVNALLGNRTQSELFIEQGRQIRLNLQNTYRLALSLDSMANSFLVSGQYNRANVFAHEAHLLFDQHYERQGTRGWERGIGLSLLTLSRTQRHLGSHAYSKGIRKSKNFQQEFTTLSEAEKNLIISEKRFLEVKEKIRLHQVYNEWACIHREKAIFFQELGRRDECVREIENADEKLELSLKYITGENSSNKLQHSIRYIDTCENRARSWAIAGNERLAYRWLKNAESAIPDEYILRRGKKLFSIPKESCVEEYWQQAGKIHYLKAELLSSSRWKSVVEEYAIAMAYFNLFRERSLTEEQEYTKGTMLSFHLVTYEAILESLYQFLNQRSKDEIKNIEEVIAPELLQEYHLQAWWLTDLYVLIRLLQISYQH